MSGRLHYIDNLRVFCILLVVFVHAGVTYSTLGSWYYTEPRTLTTASELFFAFYQSHAQAFSMSLFFFIAALFIPPSLERKGTKKFITDRLYRLGIPVLIYIFIIHPVCVKLVHPDLNILKYTVDGLRNLSFTGRTGPLWFALTLLIFTLIYVLIHKYLPKPEKISVNNSVIFSLIGIITLFAFGIRLVFPIGTSVMNLQFCYFSAYIFMFSAGIIASRYPVLEKIDLKTGRIWLLVAFAAGLPLWIASLSTGKVLEGKMLFQGGMNISSFLYALWESLFCVSFIVALFGVGRARFNSQNGVMKFLSDNTFGIYVFHAPGLIAISVMGKGIDVNPVAKFFVAGTLAVLMTLVVSSLVRKIPYAGKLFN